jgi:hypothetical protein
MALTQDEKDEVYLTVSVELIKMFDILTNHYHKPDQTEQAQLIKEIEDSLRENWDHFKLPV